ncbi:hypothetical protein, partial [Sphingobium sp. D43FB]|uniref:hypothetical protein n=1 Tax=Sphingobium sp. D43FB TaxID=2017595 RepID=UPI001C3EC800
VNETHPRLRSLTHAFITPGLSEIFTLGTHRCAVCNICAQQIFKGSGSTHAPKHLFFILTHPPPIP